MEGFIFKVAIKLLLLKIGPLLVCLLLNVVIFFPEVLLVAWRIWYPSLRLPSRARVQLPLPPRPGDGEMDLKSCRAFCCRNQTASLVELRAWWCCTEPVIAV